MAHRGRAFGSLVLAVLLVAATGVVLTSFTDLRSLIHALASGHWPWIAAGVAVHAAYFVGYALLYRLGFAVVGVASRTRSLVPVLFAGLFVNVLVPAGAGAAALFIDDAARRGQNPAAAAVGVVLVLLLDVITLIPFVAWGVWYLIRADLLAAWQMVAVIAFVLYLAVLVAMLVISHRRPAWVRRVLDVARRAAARVLGWLHVHRPLDAGWAERTASHFSDAAGAILARPGRLAGAALWAIALHLINLFGLWLFVRGFDAQPPLGGMVAAFALGILLFVVVVIPQAAPVVEATMTATFIHIGVPRGRAVAVTLAFRSVNFWLPLALGLAAAWRLRKLGVRRAELP
ncbi:MAG TPA: lysylphosphatidylglycerol synthase transmembrane domain-containing protein [Kofleriaceae bacterium]|nr:lysylphosphatidylglycerol synthase transmembrane domain-containing protein [Kofleriaceae bacterium]